MDNKRKDFLNFVFSEFERVSSDPETANDYLYSLDLDSDKVAAEGMKAIKKRQFQIQIENTKSEMDRSKFFAERVNKHVDEILNNPLFSFSDFLRQERLSFAFRNVDSLDPATQREILVQHLTLKLIEEENNNNSK